MLAAPTPPAGPPRPGPAELLATPAASLRRKSGLFLLGLALVVSVTVAAVAYTFSQHRERAVARLESTAELRATEVRYLLAERIAQARFVAEGARLSKLASDLLQEGAGASRFALAERLVAVSRRAGLSDTALVDGAGELLAGSTPFAGAPPTGLSAVITEAIEAGEPRLGRVPGGADPAAATWLIIAAPLTPTGEPARAVLLSFIDARKTLLPLLGKWPGPSASARTMLVRREGDQLIHLHGAAAQPLASPQLLAARALRGEVPMGKAYEGVDFSGRSVLGAALPVAGTGWFVVVRVETAEILADALRDSVWIAAAGLLGLLVVLFGARLTSQRRALANAEKARAEQSERLRSLRLLEALADNSTDLIFAKDLEGRYLLFNRAACEAIGRTPQEVIGFDDRQIFPPGDAEAVLANDRQALTENAVRTFEEVMTVRGRELTYLVTKGPLKDGAGVAIGLFGVSRDITERRQGEAELRDSNELVQAVKDSVLDHMAVIDSTGRILAVNDAWRRYWGENAASSRAADAAADADEAPAPADFGVGQAYVAVCERAAGPGVEDLAAVEAGIRGVIAGQTEHFTLEYPCHVPWEQRWFQVSVTPLKTRGGGAVVLHSNVTQRRRFEQVLRDSEAQYRSIFSALTEGVAIFDALGMLKACNPSAERLLARVQAAGGGRPPVREDGSTFAPDELPLARSIATGLPQRDVALGYPDDQGRPLWLRVNSEPVLNPVTGRAFEVVLSFTDVTDRQAAEQQLRKLSLAVEQNPSSILITDMDGRIEYVNAAYQRASGYHRDEVLGRNPRLLRSGHTPDETYVELWAALGAGETWSGEFVNRRKSGEEYIQLAHLSPIRQADGRITHYLAIQEDITERKRISAELDRHRNHLQEMVDERTRDLQQAIAARTESEQFTLAIADNVPGLLSYWDRDLVCRFATREVMEWFDKPADQIIGRTLHEIIGETAMREREPFVRRVLAGQSAQAEFMVMRRDGLIVPLWATFTPDFHDGEVRGFFYLLIDVFELKQTEQRLQVLNAELILARDRAESANRAKSAFLANMSHEIRTPMNAIVGMTHLLRRDSRDALQADRLDKVSEAATHLLGLLNDILDISRIESGKLLLERADFSIDDIMGRACTMVADRARVKMLEIIVQTGRVPALLNGDVTRLSQVLVNLLGNAVKFTEQGWITLRSTVLEQSAGDVLVRFEVTDTGIGITPDQMERLFNDFEQADTSTTRRFGGSGLGLAISRRLAEVMGGEAGAHSEPGVGSTFWFTVRLACVGDCTALQVPPALTGWPVLVVDDLAPAAEAIAATLRDIGLRADVAVGGTQARALAAQAAAAGDPYRLVLLDWPLAGEPGLLAQCSDPDGHGDGSACTIMSAFDEEAARVAGQRDGLGHVLPKPLTRAALLELVMRRLGDQATVISTEVAGPTAELRLRDRFAGARVLLVEDNPINQIVAVELLQAAGLQVEVADNGRAAVERWQPGAFDLVLMDIQMPELDGMAATRAIRALPGSAEVPIIAMTANAFGEDRAACLDAGMNDHIGKPVDPRVLYEVLLHWLERSALVV